MSDEPSKPGEKKEESKGSSRKDSKKQKRKQESKDTSSEYLSPNITPPRTSNEQIPPTTLPPPSKSSSTDTYFTARSSKVSLEDSPTPAEKANEPQKPPEGLAPISETEDDDAKESSTITPTESARDDNDEKDESDSHKKRVKILKKSKGVPHPPSSEEEAAAQRGRTRQLSTVSTDGSFQGVDSIGFSSNDTSDSASSSKSVGGLSLFSLRSFSSLKSRKSVEDTLFTNLEVGHAFIYMIVPPDGGYGWFVLVISFLCLAVVDGIIYSIGILLPTMALDLGVTESQIIYIGSIQIGAIGSAFINKFGFRRVALMGATVASTSLLAASFCPTLATVLIFYSFIAAPGLSMIWVTAQLIIGYYFEKLRPIANGIAVSGGAFGIALFSAMNNVLVTDIGWRNTARVHVCALVIVFFMAFSYAEVPPSIIGRVIEDVDTDTETESGEKVHSVQIYTGYILNKTDSVHTLENIMHRYKTPHHEEPGLLTRCFRACCVCCPYPDRMSQLGVKRYVIKHDPIEKKNLFYPGPVDYSEAATASAEVKDGKKVEVISRERSVDLISYTMSMIETVSARSDTSKVSTKDVKGSKVHTFLNFLHPSNWMHTKIMQALGVLFDFNLLKVKEFQFLLASAFFAPMGGNIPFVYSKERAQVNEFYSGLIPVVIGATNFTVRIASGVIAYKFKQYSTYLCGGGVAFSGLVVFVSAFYGADVIWFQLFYGIAFGAGAGLFATLRAILYVRYLGLEKLTNAFGLTGVAMGFGAFIGTTLGGALNELTGDFTAAFAFGGICLMVSGLLKLMVPQYIAYKESKSDKRRKVAFA